MALGFMPIMLLDEWRLSPSLGYTFDRRWVEPHESIVSILWKFVRMNALPGHLAAGYLSRTPVDPYDGIDAHREAIDVARMRVTLGLSRRVIRASVIAAHHRGAVCANFRYCRACLGRGYHSLLYQFERVARCPIHRRPLETACRSCGYRIAYRLNARLLETPYRCPQCRTLYGTTWPQFPSCSDMPMKDLIALTRLRFDRCLF